MLVRRPSRRGRAFTLIELLVVISIIGLLISLLIPAMSEARRIARKTVCGTNLHSIGQAIQAYLTAHNDRYPYIAEFPSEESAVAAAENRNPYPPIYEALRLEVGQKYAVVFASASEVFHCPADRNLMTPKLGSATYWDSEHTSYEWRGQFNGKRVGQDLFTSKAHGLALLISQAPLVYDFEAYHGGPKRIGSHMILYADFHVQADKWKDGKQPGSGVVEAPPSIIGT